MQQGHIFRGHAFVRCLFGVSPWSGTPWFREYTSPTCMSNTSSMFPKKVWRSIYVKIYRFWIRREDNELRSPAGWLGHKGSFKSISDASSKSSVDCSRYLFLPFSSKESSEKTSNFRSPIGNTSSILPFTRSIDFNSGKVFLVTTIISPVLSLTL